MERRLLGGGQRGERVVELVGVGRAKAASSMEGELR